MKTRAQPRRPTIKEVEQTNMGMILWNISVAIATLPPLKRADFLAGCVRFTEAGVDARKWGRIKAALAVTACMAMLLTSGCSTPTAASLEGVDFGPTPADYKQQIDHYFKRVLFDPESARIEFVDEPHKGWVRGDLDENMKLQTGWLVTCSVNAKNRYGAYAGRTSYRFIFRDGKLVHATDHPFKASE